MSIANRTILMSERNVYFSQTDQLHFPNHAAASTRLVCVWVSRSICKTNTAVSRRSYCLFVIEINHGVESSHFNSHQLNKTINSFISFCIIILILLAADKILLINYVTIKEIYVYKNINFTTIIFLGIVFYIYFQQY